MTVEELIWQLTDCPGDAQVFINSCHDGLEDATEVKRTEVVLNCTDWCGPHDFYDPFSRVYDGLTVVDGVLIR